MHDVKVISVATVPEACHIEVSTSPHFGMLLVSSHWSQDADVVAEMVARLAVAGLAYLAVWGEGCERIHDIADEVLCAVGGPGAAPDGVVMTTWHDGESLAEAVEFFVEATHPDDAYAETCDTWLIAVVGSESLAAQVRALVRS